MGKSQLIHNNEFHLISKAEIRKATGKLVESLNLAAGSTDGFDIYKVWTPILPTWTNVMR